MTELVLLAEDHLVAYHLGEGRLETLTLNDVHVASASLDQELAFLR